MPDERFYTHGKCLPFAYAFNDIYGNGEYVLFYDKKCPVHIAVVVANEIYDAGGKITPESINERYANSLRPEFVNQKTVDLYWGGIELQELPVLDMAKAFISSMDLNLPIKNNH